MQSRYLGLVLGTMAVASTLVALDFHRGGLPIVRADEKEKAKQMESCDVRTLQGGYGLTFQGFGTRGPVPALLDAFIPAAGVGVMKFDGAGGLTLAETVSTAGSIAPITTIGTYNVNADCTGSLNAPGAATWNFVIVHEGGEILAINTIQGRVATVDLQKQ